jgi:hypothetical protein
MHLLPDYKARLTWAGALFRGNRGRGNGVQGTPVAQVKLTLTEKTP